MLSAALEYWPGLFRLPPPRTGQHRHGGYRQDDLCQMASLLSNEV
jgi:hypothetical protein